MTTRKPAANITNKKEEYSCFVKIHRLEIEAEKHDGGKEHLKMRVLEQNTPVVTVLAYDPHQDQIVLVNELRAGSLAAGCDPYIDNLVTGSVHRDEDVLAAAIREMKEETGLELKDASFISQNIFSSPGGMTEKISLVFGVIDATKAGGVHGLAAEKEDLKTIVITSDEFISRAEKGMIKDLRSLTAAFWLASHKECKRKKYGVKPQQPHL